jgi:homoserine dehydrogenase
VIAENFKLLFDAHIENQVSFLYEAAVSGGIPIIKILENYYGKEKLKSISGIINGSSNYILSKMESEGESFDTVLRNAQEIGFAESDISLDIDGFDTKYKLCILAAHGFGIILAPYEVLSLGIRNISSDDLNYANNLNHRFKQIAQAYLENEEVKAFVLPQLVDSNNELFHVENEFNVVQLNGEFSYQQTFIGKGAGAHPTGHAVVSDLNAAHSVDPHSYDELANNLNTGKAYKLFYNEESIRCYISFTNTYELQDLHLSNETEIGQIGNKQYLIADLKITDLIKISPLETKLSIARI